MYHLVGDGSTVMTSYVKGYDIRRGHFDANYRLYLSAAIPYTTV